MNKKIPSFIINESNQIRTKIEQKINTHYDQFFHWKSVIAVIPLLFSVFYTVGATKNRIHFSDYWTQNIKSFSNKSKKQTLPIFLYKNLFNLQPQPNKYLSSQLINFRVDNENSKEIPQTLPLILGSDKVNTFNVIKTTPTQLQKFLNLLKIRRLNLPEFIDNKTYLTKPQNFLKKKLQLAQLYNLNTEQVYFLLKKENLFAKYNIALNEYQSINSDFSSGNSYLGNSSVTKLTKTFPIYSTQSGLNFPEKTSNKIGLENLVVNPGKALNLALVINPLTNDIIVQNPILLKKLISNLQIKDYYEPTNLDFFGGAIRRRLKYTLCSVNLKENPFNYDLRENLNPLTAKDADATIVAGTHQERLPKYPPNIGEIQNKAGNQLFQLPFQKTLVELKMQSGTRSFKSKDFKKHDNLSFSIPTPFNWLTYSDSILKPLYQFELAWTNRSPVKIQHYQYLPSIFSKKFDSNLIVDTYQFISHNYLIAFSQLSIAFFLLNLLKKLYKSYQYELGLYLLEFASRLNLYDDDIKSIINEVQNDGNVRVFTNLKTSFIDLGGMMELLPKFGEIVWHLKNKCRPTRKSNLIPKAVLLVGPPGTGKTLLVKAIGVEAKVPILIQSGNGVLEDTNGVTKLQEAFQKARDLAPCILFIDEMDTIGAKRNQLELSANQTSTESTPNISLRVDRSIKKNQQFQSNHGQSAQTSKQINALTQLLVEMDGIENRRGFIIFGATNRHESLDPALIRPGRFNEIIEIGLPTHQKRIEILKIYSNKLGIENKINWDKFANRTVGFSAADLAAIVNKSSIHSILSSTKHTENSLLHGLKDTKEIGSSEITHNLQKLPINHICSLAYYELGRDLIETILINTTKSDSLLRFLLTPRTIDNNQLGILLRPFENTNRDNTKDIIQQKIQTFSPSVRDLMIWMMAELAGKSSEILLTANLSTSRSAYHLLTTIGEIDLYRANIFAEYYQIIMGNNYSTFITKNQVEVNSNTLTMNDDNVITKMFLDFDDKQLWNSKSNWLDLVTNKLTKPICRKWFRIHLSNPETSILNDEIIFSDNYQLITQEFGFETQITNEITWNNFLKTAPDLEIQSILLINLQNTLNLLNENREDLDKNVFEFVIANNISLETVQTKIYD